MHFLITAGGTREHIDPVRFISNASSGKMGHALAIAALKAGHKVTLVTAPTALKPPVGAHVVEIENATEMFTVVKMYFPKCDCLVMAAAVADYTPVRPSKTKIKKDNRARRTLELKPTADILKWAGIHKTASHIVVGFALEDRDLRANAEKKMREKHLDMIVANTPAAIGAEHSTVHIKTHDGQWTEIAALSKAAIAGKIISTCTSRRKGSAR